MVKLMSSSKLLTKSRSWTLQSNKPPEMDRKINKGIKGELFIWKILSPITISKISLDDFEEPIPVRIFAYILMFG